MAKPRSQRYRLTFEFTLEDRGAYAAMRDLVSYRLGDLDSKVVQIVGTDRYSRIAPDYLAIEKVDTDLKEPFK